MEIDRIRGNYILPEKASVVSVMMGYARSEGKESNWHIGTYGLGPCTAIASSVVDKDNNVYRFCSHIDMGEMLGYSISEHIKKFGEFLNSIPNIKEINCKLVSSQSFLPYRDRTDKELKLLEGLQKLQEKYNFKIHRAESTVVQISPDGKISMPTKEEIKQNGYRIMKKLAIENGYKIDYSTKTPCIVDEELGCFLFEVEPYLDSLLKDESQEERNEIIRRHISSEDKEYLWSSMIKKGGNITVGVSPLDPYRFAYYLENYQEIAEKNYGHILMATKVDEPTDMSKGIRTPNEDFGF